MYESALLIAVAPAEPLVETWRAQHDLAARWGVPAHITVLYPFVAPDEIDDDVKQRVREICCEFRPFGFSLVAARRFGESVLYLAPAPEVPFRELTQAFSTAFPNYPPYGGTHADVIPHLTVLDGAPATVFDVAQRDVSRGLPIAGFADEVLLMAGKDVEDSWRIVERFSLDRAERQT